MLRKEIVFEDFDGEVQEEVHHFNLSKSDLSRLVLEEMTFGENEDDKPVDGLSERIANVIKRRDGKELVRFFEWLIEVSYGVREGNKFIKSPELSQDFKHTAAYDALFMELVTDTDAIVDFVNGIMPKDIVEDPEFQSHREEFENRTK